MWATSPSSRTSVSGMPTSAFSTPETWNRIQPVGRQLLIRLAQMIGEALPNSLRLAVGGFVIGIGLALVLGVLAATNRDTWLDNGVKFLAILGQAIPGFWLAIVLIYIFAVHWQVLPPAGVGPATS